MKLKDYMKEAHATAVEKGWWENENRSFGEDIALMHSELSEALEEHRNNQLNIHFNSYDSAKPEGIAVELADVLIRIFDVCEHREIPLEEALKLKMVYNKTRPYRHGGKAL